MGLGQCRTLAPDRPLRATSRSLSFSACSWKRGRLRPRKCRATWQRGWLGQPGPCGRGVPPLSIGCTFRQSVVVALCPAKGDHDILPLDESRGTETLPEGCHYARGIAGRTAAENPISGIAACCAPAASGHIAALLISVGQKKQSFARFQINPARFSLEPISKLLVAVARL